MRRLLPGGVGAAVSRRFCPSGQGAIHAGAVGKARDRWIAFDKQQHFNDDRAMRARIAAHKDDRKRSVVPLSAWTEADCVAVIDAMTARVDATLLENAVDGDVQFVFEGGAWQLDEKRFFTIRPECATSCAR